jgi:hypothetical protein
LGNYADLEPKVKISGNKLINYAQYHGPRNFDAISQKMKGLDKSSIPYSSFSQGSRKRLKESLNKWIDTVTYATQLLRIKSVLPIRQHTFITLTLSSPQIHCDKFIKRELLNKFLINARNNYNVKNFIWKAELQENQNIHFHLLSEGRVPHEQLRKDWNRFQECHGYVSRSNNFQFNHNPNSTDIHALQKIRNVSAYVGKYMSKESLERPICGHTWGRSDGIDKLLPFSFYESLEMLEWGEMQRNSVPHKHFNADKFAVTTFLQRINLRTLPPHIKRELTEITHQNLRALSLLP